MKRVAINGFGRIGRYVAKILLKEKEVELVAINDLAPLATLAHLLKYDSVHGKFDGTVALDSSGFILNGKAITVTKEKDPKNLPWSKLNIDVVIDCTGIFRTKETAGYHIEAGAKKVIISAPAKDSETPTFVMGVNDKEINSTDLVVSNASCTTNCAAPMFQIVNNVFKIENAFLTTIHSYTNDQRLHDAPHSDLRRARAAAQSIIPTTTGAANALIRLFPYMKGKLEGSAIRVPVPDGSLTELTCLLAEKASVGEVNQLFEEASNARYSGIVSYNEDPIVSIDIIGNPYSVVFDSTQTKVVGNMLKIVGWYDNEAGYSNRLKDLLLEL